MPQVELLGLISTGNTSEPVHAYFTQYLTEQVNTFYFYLCIYIYYLIIISLYINIPFDLLAS